MPSLLPAPQELAPGLAEGVEGADHHEVAHGAGADGAAAQAVDEVVEGYVGAARAFGDDRFAAVLAEVAHVVEADAHGVLGLNRQGSIGLEIAIRLRQACRLGVGTCREEGGPRANCEKRRQGSIGSGRQRTSERLTSTGSTLTPWRFRSSTSTLGW